MKRSVLAILMVLAVAFVAAATLSAQAPTKPITLAEKVAMGKVTFNHTSHAKLACDTCHTAAKPTATDKKIKETPGQKNPYHAAMGKAGLCVDCHKTEAKNGNAKVPATATAAKCTGCHKKG